MPDEVAEARSAPEDGADAEASVRAEQTEAAASPARRSVLTRLTRLAHRTRAGLSRLGPVGGWLAGVAAAVVAAVLTSWAMTHLAPQDRADELPFTVAVQSSQNPTVGWISDRRLSQVPARPSADSDWDPWAAETGAVPIEQRTIYLTVQGRSAAQVTITDLRVRVVARRPAITGTHFLTGGGDAGIFRWMETDLDEEPPAMSAKFDESVSFLAPEHELRPIRFPYRVSLSDAETFAVEAHADQCDCDWIIELAWASQGRTGTIVIDNDGRPFRLSGSRNAVTKCYTMREQPEQCQEP